jgi:hypothetical protein
MTLEARGGCQPVLIGPQICGSATYRTPPSAKRYQPYSVSGSSSAVALPTSPILGGWTRSSYLGGPHRL